MHSTKALSAARRGMVVLGIAGGITLLGAGFAASSAAADENGLPPGIIASDDTSGEDGVLSGNQVDADADAPVDVSGNQVTVIGDGNESAGDGDGPRAEVSPSGDVDHTDGDDGTLSGNQLDAEAEAPVDVSGNQVTVIGDGNDSGGASSGAGDCGSTDAGSGDSTSGEDGLVSGNQVDADVDAPVEASGNQVTVIGDDNTSGGASSESVHCGSSDAGSGDSTSGEDGIGSGNQVGADPAAPVDASGNQVTVIGDGNQSGGASSGGSGDGDGAGSDGSEGDTTSGEDGIGSGNQVGADPAAPVDASGNQVTVIGDGNQSGGASSGGSGDGDGAGSDGSEGDTTSGEGGIGSGNQVDADPAAPVGASGNQVTILGDGNQSGDDPSDADDPGEPETPGDEGPGDEGPGDGGDGPGDEDGEDGSGSDDGDGGEVAGIGSGGPGRPATGPLSGLGSLDGAPSTVLPQTGVDHANALATLTGLLLLIAGAGLMRPRGRTRLAS